MLNGKFQERKKVEQKEKKRSTLLKWELLALVMFYILNMLYTLHNDRYGDSSLYGSFCNFLCRPKWILHFCVPYNVFTQPELIVLKMI